MSPPQLERRPLYLQVHDRLLALIQEGGLQPGERLPSETDLAGRFGISRATLREALRLLEDEGIVVRRHGVGTFVAANAHLETGLERLESVLALAGRQGMETRVEDLVVATVEADRAVAERLRVERGTPLTSISRTILVADRPAAYMQDLVLPSWLTPDQIDEGFSGSVLDLLRRRYPRRIQEALAEITAVRAGRTLARRLGVHPDAALLLIEETLFEATGTPIGFSRNYFVPDRFRFHVVRR